MAKMRSTEETGEAAATCTSFGASEGKGRVFQAGSRASQVRGQGPDIRWIEGIFLR